MKKIFLSLLLLSTQRISAQNFPEIQTFTLKNGLRVFLLPFGQIPSCSVQLLVNCGRKNETPGQQDYSQLAADCLGFGTAKYNQTQLQSALFRLGTSLQANAGEQFTSIQAAFSEKQLAEGLSVFSEAVLHPAFPEKDIKQSISQLIDFNNPDKMDISDQASVFSNFWLFGAGSPLGRYFYKDQLMKVTADSLREFYQFNFTPRNSRLLLCGHFDAAAVQKMVEQYFGPWTAEFGEVNGVVLDRPVISKKEYAFIPHQGAVQCALEWMKMGPDPTSKDLLAFRAANQIFNDVIFKEIREKGGKTYGISSSYSVAQASPVIRINTMVRNEEMYNTIRLFDTTLQQFYARGITDAELKNAKTTLRNNWTMIQEPEAVMGFFNPLLFPRADLRKNYLQLVDGLTADEVNKAIKKYLNPDSYKLLIAGDENALASSLQHLPGLIRFHAKDIQVNQ